MAATLSPSVVIRAARSQERHALEELQLRASTHWPTYRAHLAAHPGVVAIPPAQIEDGLVRVAERRDEVAGFAVLLPPVAGACELDGLFVEPSRMGNASAACSSRTPRRSPPAQGAERIDVIANPDAVGFYERVGFGGDDEVATRFGRRGGRGWRWSPHRPGATVGRVVAEPLRLDDGEQARAHGVRVGDLALERRAHFERASARGSAAARQGEQLARRSAGSGRRSTRPRSTISSTTGPPACFVTPSSSASAVSPSGRSCSARRT